MFYTTECPPDPRIAYRSLDTDGRDYSLHSHLVCQNQRRRSGLMRVLKSIVEEIHTSAPLQCDRGNDIATNGHKRSNPRSDIQVKVATECRNLRRRVRPLASQRQLQDSR